MEDKKALQRIAALAGSVDAAVSILDIIKEAAINTSEVDDNVLWDYGCGVCGGFTEGLEITLSYIRKEIV